MTARTIKALNFDQERINIVITTMSVLQFMAAVVCILIILVFYIRDQCMGIKCSFVLLSPKRFNRRYMQKGTVFCVTFNFWVMHVFVLINDQIIIWGFLQYNQQDATLYSILYCFQCSTSFRRFFRPSSGAQTVHTASGVCQACLLLLLEWVSWQYQLTHSSSSNKQA